MIIAGVDERAEERVVPILVMVSQIFDGHNSNKRGGLVIIVLQVRGGSFVLFAPCFLQVLVGP